jgi:DeoR/GlpR family transcriptional regulator of sugar metabolism
VSTAFPAESNDVVFLGERRAEIARMVEAEGRARVSDLAVRFGVSSVTIRKDLVVLERQHRVFRVHGGAIARTGSRAEAAFEIRERLQGDEKDAIGSAAAARVSDGESIALDSSTSALHLARHLKTRNIWHRLTIITNGIRAASELAGHPGITVVMLGGRVRWEALSVVGPQSGRVFRRLNVQKAFVGAVGFTMEEGLTDATEDEVQVKRSMVAAARETYALVDHTKWGRVSTVTFCQAQQIRAMITDEDAPADLIDALRHIGVEVEQVSV